MDMYNLTSKFVNLIPLNIHQTRYFDKIKIVIEHVEK